jgi:hypothetical protein
VTKRGTAEGSGVGRRLAAELVNTFETPAPTTSLMTRTLTRRWERPIRDRFKGRDDEARSIGCRSGSIGTLMTTGPET